MGKKHVEYMLYALTQPERELLVIDKVLEPLNTFTIRQWVFNYLIVPHVVQNTDTSQLSLAVLVSWPIRSL